MMDILVYLLKHCVNPERGEIIIHLNRLKMDEFSTRLLLYLYLLVLLAKLEFLESTEELFIFS